VFAHFVLNNEVSTESDSDRVSTPAISTLAVIETRSLPLPVLTSSPSPIQRATGSRIQMKMTQWCG